MSKSRIAIVLAICAALGVVGVIVWALTKEGPLRESASEPETVSVEIRAMPVAKIRVDGKAVGNTPLSLRYPKSNRELEIEAVMQPNIYDRKGRLAVEPVTEIRKVKLDQDHTIDFLAKNPKRKPPEEELEIDPKTLGSAIAK